MAEIWGAAIAAAGAIGGAYMSSKAAKDSARMVQGAAQQVGTNLTGSTIYGPGGINASVYQDGQGGSFNLGNLQNSQNMLAMFGQQGIQQAANMGSGLPQNISLANQQANQMGWQQVQGGQAVGTQAVNPNNQFLDFMSPSLQTQFGNASQALTNAQGGFQRGLQNTAFTGAAQQAAVAGQDFSGVRDSTLSTLRAQAQPFEQRQMNDLQQNLFSTGRLGTSGGGMMAEAFARGLGQADLDRQLQANNEARMQQQQALGMSQGLAGIGAQTQGLEQNLLQNAFGNWQNTLGLGANLNNQQFNQQLGAAGQNFQQQLASQGQAFDQRLAANNQNFNNAQALLQNQIGLAGLPMALQGQQLQLGMQGLQGSMALQDMGLQQFQAALAASQAGANARIGSGSNVAALTGIAAGMPTSNDIWGNALTGIASRVGSQVDWGGILGRGYNTQQIGTGYAANQALAQAGF